MQWTEEEQQVLLNAYYYYHGDWKRIQHTHFQKRSVNQLKCKMRHLKELRKLTLKDDIEDNVIKVVSDILRGK